MANPQERGKQIKDLQDALKALLVYTGFVLFAVCYILLLAVSVLASFLIQGLESLWRRVDRATGRRVEV